MFRDPRFVSRCWLFAIAVAPDRRARSRRSRSRPVTAAARDVAAHKDYGTHFQTSDRCVACHNGITTPTGEDISIGVNWRTSMMANAGRDPYWMAGVRREMIDHPDRRRRASRTSAPSATCR